MKVAVLPAAFRCSYNFFTFDGATTETVGIQSVPHYDQAGRTITHMEYSLTLRSVIVPVAGNQVGDVADVALIMDNLRMRLQSPGGELVYEDRGFGSFSINTAEVKDVKWGPKPRVLSWQTWGDGNAAQIEWTVSVCIPECNVARYEDAIMAFNFKVEYDIDGDGFTTRRVSGYVEIPQTRDGQGIRRFRHSADEYRDKIVPGTPSGFRPLASKYSLSEDKCRLDFSFGDEEMGNAIPPPGCLHADAQMTATNFSAQNANAVIYVFDGKYDLKRGVSARIAKKAFVDFVKNRKAIIEKETVVIGDGPLKGRRQPLLPFAWRASEPKIYGKVKTCVFSATWVGYFTLRDFLRTTGMWEPVDSNWNLWKATLQDVLPFDKRGVRGNAKMKFDPKSDVIVDLCQTLLTEQKITSVTTVSDSKLTAGSATRSLRSGFVLYEQTLHEVSVDNAIVHKPLNGSNTVITGQRCQPTNYVIHTGRAIRVNEPVAAPKLVRIGTFYMEPADRPEDGLRQSIRPGVEDRLYYASWRHTYIAKNTFGQNGPLYNPLFDEGNAFLTFEDQEQPTQSTNSTLQGGMKIF